MAKQGKVLQARRQRTRSEGSVLLRSAESLGRMIGSLQRQLDNAARRLGHSVDNAADRSNPSGNNGHTGKAAKRERTRETRVTAKTKRANGKSASASRKAATASAAKKTRKNTGVNGHDGAAQRRRR